MSSKSEPPLIALAIVLAAAGIAAMLLLFGIWMGLRYVPAVAVG